MSDAVIILIELHSGKLSVNACHYRYWCGLSLLHIGFHTLSRPCHLASIFYSRLFHFFLLFLFGRFFLLFSIMLKVFYYFVLQGFLSLLLPSLDDKSVTGPTAQNGCSDIENRKHWCLPKHLRISVLFCFHFYYVITFITWCHVEYHVESTKVGFYFWSSSPWPTMTAPCPCPQIISNIISSHVLSDLKGSQGEDTLSTCRGMKADFSWCVSHTEGIDQHKVINRK